MQIQIEIQIEVQIEVQRCKYKYSCLRRVPEVWLEQCHWLEAINERQSAFEQWYNAIHYNEQWYNTIRCDTMRNKMIQYNTMRNDTMTDDQWWRDCEKCSLDADRGINAAWLVPPLPFGNFAFTLQAQTITQLQLNIHKNTEEMHLNNKFDNCWLGLGDINTKLINLS